MSDYQVLECESASVRLPADCEIAQNLPKLSAKLRLGLISIDAWPDDFIWQAMSRQIDSKIPSNPECRITVVRQGVIDLPYSGKELAADFLTLATAKYSFTWDVLMEEGKRRAIIGVTDSGMFAESEEVCESILQSFRFR